MAHRVTLIPGDGIGPELAEATRRVLDATGIEFEWEVVDAGEATIAAHGTPLPDEVLESIRRNKVAIKGPITTPVGEGFRSVNVTLRQALGLYANLRPARSMQGVVSRFDGIDLVIVRENTEDLYAGIEHRVGRDAAESIKIITREASERIARFAFEYAVANGRRKVTAVHKANIMKLSDGLFLESCRTVAADYAGRIEFEDRIVDNMCMQLVQKPELYDVLVLPNLYGDIVSDLAAGLVGGLGVAPGANIGPRRRRVRGGPRLGAEVRRPEQGQPDRADPVGGADAPPPRPSRRRGPAGGGPACGRRRGSQRDLRSGRERRHEPVRRRDHRAARRTRTDGRRRRHLTDPGAPTAEDTNNR